MVRWEQGVVIVDKIKSDRLIDWYMRSHSREKKNRDQKIVHFFI